MKKENKYIDELKSQFILPKNKEFHYKEFMFKLFLLHYNNKYQNIYSIIDIFDSKDNELNKYVFKSLSREFAYNFCRFNITYSAIILRQLYESITLFVFQTLLKTNPQYVNSVYSFIYHKNDKIKEKNDNRTMERNSDFHKILLKEYVNNNNFCEYSKRSVNLQNPKDNKSFIYSILSEYYTHFNQYEKTNEYKDMLPFIEVKIEEIYKYYIYICSLLLDILTNLTNVKLNHNKTSFLMKMGNDSYFFQTENKYIIENIFEIEKHFDTFKPILNKNGVLIYNLLSKAYDDLKKDIPIVKDMENELKDIDIENSHNQILNFYIPYPYDDLIEHKKYNKKFEKLSRKKEKHNFHVKLKFKNQYIKVLKKYKKLFKDKQLSLIYELQNLLIFNYTIQEMFFLFYKFYQNILNYIEDTILYVESFFIKESKNRNSTMRVSSQLYNLINLCSLFKNSEHIFKDCFGQYKLIEDVNNKDFKIFLYYNVEFYTEQININPYSIVTNLKIYFLYLENNIPVIYTEDKNLIE